MQLWHLARRFVGSLSSAPPSAECDAWAAAQLVPGEKALWSAMSNQDRRHGIGVACDVERLLGDKAARPVMAAALLHDVGKIDSGLGTFARVFATVVDRRQGDSRFARYRRHPELGAAMLQAAGADELTSTWAREHHLPRERWTLPLPIANALHVADAD